MSNSVQMGNILYIVILAIFEFDKTQKILVLIFRLANGRKTRNSDTGINNNI